MEGLLFAFLGVGGLVTFSGAAGNAAAHSTVELALRLSTALAAILAGVGLLRRRRWGATACVVWMLVQFTTTGVVLASSVRQRGMPQHSTGHWMLLALIFSAIMGSVMAMVGVIWRRSRALA
jgi:hypothetical protein